LHPPWLVRPRRGFWQGKVRPESISARSFFLSLDFSVFSVFSVVQDLFGFRQADGPAEAMRGALHSLYQQTKLPDTIYGAYALKPYNI
jgi:hypothetical protein